MQHANSEIGTAHAPRRAGATRGHTRLLTMLLAVCAVVTLTIAPAAANPKYASMVIDAETGRVLFSRNADASRYPASLTKMMTLYMTFEALDQGRITLGTQVKMSANAARRPPSKLGLKAGASLTVEQAILSLAIKSANDVATALAELIGGSEQKFAELMTRKARQLGMTKTRFKNASGLTAKGQLSSARDMAILGRKLVSDYPQYYRFFGRQRFTFRGTTYTNFNKLLGDYSGTDGIKTGYTHASGFNLVASVKRKGRHLIGVVMGGRSSVRRDRHMKQILTRVFSRIDARPTHQRLARGEVPNPIAKPIELAARYRRPQDVATVGRIVDVLIPAARPPIAQGATPPEPREIAEGPREVVEVLLPPPNPLRERVAGGPALAASDATDLALSLVGQGDGLGDAEEGLWGLQVGAYSLARAAARQVEVVMSRFPHLLDDAIAAIVPTERDGRTLYRARIEGMEASEADRACAAIKASGTDCLRVPSLPTSEGDGVLGVLKY